MGAEGCCNYEGMSELFSCALNLSEAYPFQYIVWSIIGLEVAVRILSLFPTGRLSAAILPVAIPALRPTIGIQVEPRTWMIPTLTSAPSSAFYLGVLTVGVGFAIRLSCFRTLGRHFSFLHTTLAGHRLISGGPYGVVRHPSYTGEVLVRFGVLAILLRADGIVAASGALSMATTTFASDVSQVAIPVVAHAVLVGLLRAAIAGYAGWISFACPYLLLRARKEDATLRESFGKEWDEYAARVPYRFIPYIA